MERSDEVLATTLISLWDRFVECCAGLDEADLRRPTRLGDWTVHDLLAHHAPTGYSRVLDAAANLEPPASQEEMEDDVARLEMKPLFIRGYFGE